MIIRKPTISVYFDQRRKKKNGKYPVKLRLSASWLRQRDKYFYIGLDLTPDEWEQVDGKGRSVAISDARDQINAQLADAHRIVNEMDYYTHGLFEDQFIRGVVQEKFVYDFFERKIKDLESKNKFSTVSGYKAALAALKDFKRNRPIYFQDVTIIFLQDFISHLESIGKTDGTISRYFSYFQAVYNIAVEHRIVKADFSPFKSSEITLGKERKVKKALSDESIKKILSYYSVDRNKQLARDLWVFSFCVGGANMPDIARMTKSSVSGDGLFYHRGKTGNAKTKDEPIVVALNDPAKAIINRYAGDNYLLPILEPGMDEAAQYHRIKWYVRKVNRALKEICKELNIDRSTFGSARHSFATRMNRMGADQSVIGVKMGHAAGSSITERYIKKEAEQSKGIFAELVNF